MKKPPTLIPFAFLKGHSGCLGGSWLSGFLLWTCLTGIISAADIAGRVLLVGAPPPEVLVDLGPFPECRAIAPQPLKTRHYLVSPDGGLANVFVYIQAGLPGKSFAAPTNAPVLNQFRCGFHPYVMGLQAGQKFAIKNSEPYLETVHALPRINKEFNFAQPVTGMTNWAQFDQPEVLIRIKCEIHPWEFAFVGVVDHPFFAVTDAAGRFQLPSGLPGGTYVLAAVHPKAGASSLEFTVGDTEKKTIDFKLKPPVQAPP